MVSSDNISKTCNLNKFHKFPHYLMKFFSVIKSSCALKALSEHTSPCMYQTWPFQKFKMVVTFVWVVVGKKLPLIKFENVA